MKPQTIKKQEEKLHEKVQLCTSRGKSLRKTGKPRNWKTSQDFRQLCLLSMKLSVSRGEQWSRGIKIAKKTLTAPKTRRDWSEIILFSFYFSLKLLKLLLQNLCFSQIKCWVVSWVWYWCIRRVLKGRSHRYLLGVRKPPKGKVFKKNSSFSSLTVKDWINILSLRSQTDSSEHGIRIPRRGNMRRKAEIRSEKFWAIDFEGIHYRKQSCQSTKDLHFMFSLSDCRNLKRDKNLLKW